MTKYNNFYAKTSWYGKHQRSSMYFMSTFYDPQDSRKEVAIHDAQSN